MSNTASKQIPESVLDILSRGRSVGNIYYLPDEKLDLKTYKAVNAVLEALGGGWHRRSKGHVFPLDAGAESRIEAAITSGCYDDPKALAFFPTPLWIAQELVEDAEIEVGHLCLEPSAGMGVIANTMAAKVGRDLVRCYEVDAGRADVLAAAGYVTCRMDFLDAIKAPLYDRVVMNPPFSVPGRPQADIDHVLHALSFLKPGGKLVSVMSAGVMYRSNKKTMDFRDLVDSNEGSITALPEDAFAESGTSVRTCKVEIFK